ncbi:alpha/beta hydrolase [Streptococcus cristatus]|uniref:Alpha/beta hydrolase n=1 Tax=Streptococcus cristatus TaxID=45634 RepID=A0A5B0DKI8_STRCR|nr:alpha/beta hydrolase [Streptococcus cristatus]KAA0967324.1 alpha/beta hydrolase [Streptococcus cristatus]
MRKRSIIALSTFLFIALVTLFLVSKLQTRELNSRDYIQSRTPTLFFHGYGSSANAEKHMVEAARQAGVTQTIITATVDSHAQVTFKGDIPNDAINPIVMVEFKDNRNPNYAQDGEYVAAVVRKLQAKYAFKKMNFVAHSMGNMSILFYLLEHAQNEEFPKLQKQVNIANHVNGLEGMDLPANLTILDNHTGQPSAMSNSYQKLLSLREIYPQDQVHVLNIYGDFKNQSDGSVLNVSSRSLKYLVIDNAKSYQEKRVTGPLAQHSQLHENPEVDRLLIDFLWGK